MSSDKHLPDFMQDFHDQKNIFKSIYTLWQNDKTPSGGDNVLKEITWVDAHIFTIDFFLWFMALHGYKLQKIKNKKMDFYDIEETVKNRAF